MLSRSTGLFRYGLASCQLSFALFSETKRPFGGKKSPQAEQKSRTLLKTQMKQKERWVDKEDDSSNDMDMEPSPQSESKPAKKKQSELDTSKSLFFEGIAQSAGNFKEKMHSFKPQQPLESLLVKVKNTNDPQAKLGAQVKLLLAQQRYSEVVEIYNQITNKSVVEQSYIEALWHTDAAKALELSSGQGKKKVPFNYQSMLTGVLSSSLPLSQVKKALASLGNRKEKELLNTIGFNLFFKNELEGKFSSETADKLQLLISTFTNYWAQLSINFNLKKLLSQIRASGLFSDLHEELLDLLERLLMLQRYVAPDLLIHSYIKNGRVEELIELLSAGPNIQQNAEELGKELIELKYQNKLAHLNTKHIIEYYGKIRSEKKVAALYLLLEFASVLHLDSIIIDAFSHCKDLTGQLPSPKLETIYSNSLLRLPLTSFEPLNSAFKNLNRSRLSEIKLNIKSNDIELAFKKFELNRYKPLILEFQREHLRHFLYVYYSNMEMALRQTRERIDTFCQRLDSDSLLKLFFNEEDYNQKIGMYLSKDYESLWETTVQNQMLEAPKVEFVPRKSGFQRRVKSVLEGDNLTPEQEKMKLSRDLELYMLELQAILIECQSTPPTELLPKFLKLQETARPEMIKVLDLENLYNFNFIFSDPAAALEALYKLRDHDYRMVLELDFTNRDMINPITAPKAKGSQEGLTTPVLPLKYLNLEHLPTLIVDFNDLWEASRKLVKLPPVNDVDELLVWGVEQREPMAIYMGEKLAMLTRQKIPHGIAKAVAQVLSIKKFDTNLDQKCKDALALVGRIVRDDIYDFDKQYAHIFQHTDYQKHLAFLSEFTFHPLKDNLLSEQLYNPIRWVGKDGPTRESLLSSIKERAAKM